MTNMEQPVTLADIGNVLARIEGLTEAAPSTGPWEFLADVRSVRRIQSDAESLTQQLRADYSDEQLLRVGVLRRHADNGVTLSPVLADERRQLVLLRSGKEQQPFDAVNDAGCLVSSDPPLFTATRDWLTDARAQETNRVLVFSSTADWCVGRQLGLAGTTTAQLASMQGDAVRHLLTPSDQRDNANGNVPLIRQNDYRLVFVAFQLETLSLEEPPELLPLLQRLVHAADILQQNTSGWVRVLVPSRPEFEQLVAAVSFADAQMVRKAIDAMLKISTLSIAEFLRRPRGNHAETYVETRRTLAQQMAGSDRATRDSLHVRASVEAMRRAYHEQFVEPAVVAAVNDRDPLRQVILLASAEMLEKFSEAELERLLDRDSPQADPMLEREKLEDALRIAEAAAKLHREMMRGK